ncbi:SPOR domain-containing protein [Rheinheimera sp.]|uniref:SPOR domain-containing protein n=1 Tax=Rheinheimera sp. TaxID=1869214 RepID=UPI00307E6ABA
MNSALKNRLIGSSILVIAAVVFLPDLLDGEKQIVREEFKAIPQRPEFSTVQQEQVFTKEQLAEKQQELLNVPDDRPALDTLPAQDFAQVTAGAAGSEASTDTAQMLAEPVNPLGPGPETIEQAAVQQADEQTSTEAAASLAQTAAPEPKGNPALNAAAWIVQVGSFSKSDNAAALVSKLKQAGFTTFTRASTNSQGQSMTSVVVGPELKKDRLQSRLSELEQLTGVKGLKLSPFKPIENN